ncbi:MAG: hypothetical protein JXQ27_02940 [Acidobacteria bacterium]|nr:hypothetical protein [Acidobacteriota bacterium]
MKKVLIILLGLLILFLTGRWIWYQFVQSDEDKIRAIISDATTHVAQRKLLPLFKDFAPDFHDDHGLDLPTLQALTYRVFGRAEAFEATTDIQDIRIDSVRDHAVVRLTIRLFPVQRGVTGPEIFQAARRSNLFYVLFVRKGGDWKVLRSAHDPLPVEAFPASR